ncbi:hypothetical protein CK203_025692 [Vitis vinifera]|uniref:Endonuclease/exonuclease/phosphatase domain-containing protein n=1 Tax=Vitis vinifera TaxID=29760 RepID=A0A438IGB3_VITVI|nr:hypothetical protein CK203_025692 [Vitis vinifera]
MAEREIVDEAFRYGSSSNLRVGESSLFSSSLFGRTPEREFCNHSGDLRRFKTRNGPPAMSGPQVLRSEKETNWEESSLAKFSKLLGFSIEGVGRFLDWRTLEAVGAVGGVLICWDKKSLELLEWEEGQFSISCKFRNCGKWGSLGVHGCLWPFTKKDRECLWDELGAVRGLWGDPWCVGGDFNVILAQGERSRQGRVTLAMRRFAQVMDDLEIIDLPFKGALSRGVGGFIIKPGPG